MASYFSEIEERKASWRALQIWQILIGCAHNQQIITYRQIADILGYKGAGTLAQILGKIMYFCEKNELPPLTCLVVNTTTGAPGEGLVTLYDEYPNTDLARVDVFNAEWYLIVPPTIDELDAATMHDEK